MSSSTTDDGSDDKKGLLTRDPGHPSSNLLPVEEMIVSEPIECLPRYSPYHGGSRKHRQSAQQTNQPGENKNRTMGVRKQFAQTTCVHIFFGLLAIIVSRLTHNASVGQSKAEQMKCLMVRAPSTEAVLHSTRSVRKCNVIHQWQWQPPNEVQIGSM